MAELAMAFSAERAGLPVDMASFAASLPHTHEEADEEGVDEPEHPSEGEAHREELRSREAASKKAADDKNRLR